MARCEDYESKVPSSVAIFLFNLSFDSGLAIGVGSSVGDSAADSVGDSPGDSSDNGDGTVADVDSVAAAMIHHT